MAGTEQSQPSQEELRAYLEQLREAEASEVVVQAYTMLGTGAEVKLGRSDARVLIDAMNAMVDAVGARLPGDLTAQMQGGVRQLQMAQVEAERQAGAPSSPPQQPEAAPQPPQPQPPPAPATDRLWIPGRDAGPPRRP